MPALVAGIHVSKPRRTKDVDGRNKSGHDGVEESRSNAADITGRLGVIGTSPNNDYVTRLRRADGPSQARNQRQKIGKTICFCAQNDNGDLQHPRILLMVNALIDGDKDIKLI